MSRNTNAHPADKFCREIINRYPKMLVAADLFSRDRTFLNVKCPDWCALPSHYTAAVLAGSVNTQDIMNTLNIEVVYSLTAALIWSRGKMIYRFDNTLADTLANQPLDGDIPADILEYLPHQCVYIERDMILGGYFKVIGFFAWLDWGTKDNAKELRLDFIRQDNTPHSMVIPIFGGTLLDSLLAVANTSLQAISG